MPEGVPLADYAPLARLAAVALALAALPLAWWWLRHRDAAVNVRLSALTTLTLFLCFDLVVFGAFTRLSDAGLGCPDWPGCYGEASPLGARADIGAAEAALPDGPVTWSKAWIEMIHRYLAMTVGVLIIALAAKAWLARAVLPHAWWWAIGTLAWVVLQGLAGRYTVTLKLYPAVVTAHLIGGMLLLGLLAAQRESYRDRPLVASGVLRGAATGVLALLIVQIALGGWVSTNYAVLACRGFPTCNGEWWPAADFEQAFVLLRELGQDGAGGWVAFDALVAIHLAHRIGAVVTLAALAALAALLWRGAADPARRRYATSIAVLGALQLASGLSNVVLDWPIGAALAHSAGAAALVVVLVSLTARLQLGSRSAAAHRSAARMRLA